MDSPPATPLIRAVAGIIQSPKLDTHRGRYARAVQSYLLVQRPPNKVLGGYWEFPGGKIESFETPPQALCRELEEEIGIKATRIIPWLIQEHRYEHASVHLACMRVTQWHGEIVLREGQTGFCYQAFNCPVDEEGMPIPSVSPLLMANYPIIRALSLPPFYGISMAGDLGIAPQLTALERSLQQGLQGVQIREPTLSLTELRGLVINSHELCRQYGAQLILNVGDQVSPLCALAKELQLNGIHIPARGLLTMKERPPFKWVGASIHDRHDLQKAIKLGCDFAMLGSVQTTRSHPEGKVLGWEEFGNIIQDTSIPIYALGGLEVGDLAKAEQQGAHGIAMRGGAWL